AGQRMVAFYFQDRLATSVTIRILDQGLHTSEEFRFPASTDIRHFRTAKNDPVIFGIEIDAPHANRSEAQQSRTFIDDLEFTADPVPFVPFVPSLVLGLRHTPNQVNPFIGTLRDDILSWQGGDIGGPAGSGYTWFSTPDEPGADPRVWAQKIPPGV